MKLRDKYPNNKPSLVTVEDMERKGMSLLCEDVNGPFGYHGAWFVNVFGVCRMNFLNNDWNKDDH